MCVWVGFDRQRHRKTCRSLVRELGNQGTFRFFVFCFFVSFWRSPQLTAELDHFVRGGEALLRTRGMMGSRKRFWQGTHEAVTRYMVTPLLSLEVATPESKSIHSTLSSICKKVRLTSGFSRMQLSRSFDLPSTSRRFAKLGASNACLVGENPTCSVPAS